MTRAAFAASERADGLAPMRRKHLPRAIAFIVVDGVDEYLVADVDLFCAALNYIQFPQPLPGEPGWCWESIALAA